MARRFSTARSSGAIESLVSQAHDRFAMRRAPHCAGRRRRSAALSRSPPCCRHPRTSRHVEQFTAWESGAVVTRSPRDKSAKFYAKGRPLCLARSRGLAAVTTIGVSARSSGGSHRRAKNAWDASRDHTSPRAARSRAETRRLCGDVMIAGLSSLGSRCDALFLGATAVITASHCGGTPPSVRDVSHRVPPTSPQESGTFIARKRGSARCAVRYDVDDGSAALADADEDAGRPAA